MRKQIVKNKILTVAIVGLAFASFYSNAFAWGHGGGRYEYRGGRWHTHGWFGLDLVVGFPPMGQLLQHPVGYTTVVIGGVSYYCYDNMYYRLYPSGYVVVAPPVGAVVTALPPGCSPVMVTGSNLLLL